MTVEAVQDSLGFGSAIAVHKHLVTWRSMQEKPAETAPAALPESLASALADWASESDARLAGQMELVGVTTERDNLAAEIKQLRAQRCDQRRAWRVPRTHQLYREDLQRSRARFLVADADATNKSLLP